MDDLVRDGLFMILAACAAGVVILVCVAQLILMELHALSTGDWVFVAASAAVLLLLSAGYIVTGFWLRRSGWI